MHDGAGTAVPPQHPGGTFLIGRAAERKATDAVLDAVRSGLSKALVVRGEAGMGKTALLQDASSRATDCVVLSIAGIESEASYAFGGLHRLLIPVMAAVGRLPIPQREAINAAFGFQPGTGRDRFLVGMGLLTLLADVAAERPVLCIVDDAHWLDRESSEALAFVARRLYADRIGMLFGVRPSSDQLEVLADLPALDVEGLAAADAAELVRRHSATAVDAAVASRIARETEGCPLAIVELADQLTSDQLSGGATLPQPLPLGRRLEQHFLRRIRALPADSQTFLLAMAAEPPTDSALFTRVTRSLDLPPGAGEPAVEAGLIEGDGRPRFRHPLIRSAAYAGAPMELRRRVHQTIAAAINPAIDSERYAWHLSAATSGPDEAAAAAVEAAAVSAGRRGGREAESALLVRAAELSVDSGESGRRMLAAAVAAFRGGRPHRAEVLLAAASPALAAPELRARAQWLDGVLQVPMWRPGAGASRLLAAATALAPHDPAAAWAAMFDALDAYLVAGDQAEGIGPSDVARAIMNSRAEGLGDLTDLMLDAFGHLYLDDFPEAAPVLRATLDAVLAAPLTREECGRFIHAAIVLADELWDDRAYGHVVHRAQGAVLEEGLLIPMLAVLSSSATHATRSGQFQTAATYYGRAADAAYAAGAIRNSTELAARLDILLRAWRGEPGTDGDARRLIDEAAGTGSGVVMELGLHALAIFELGAGNYGAALTAASRLAAGALSWRSHALPIVIEAAMRSGRPDVATDALQRLEARATGAATPWAMGVLSRSKALRAASDAAEAFYREGLELLETTSVLIEVARTKLLYGEWLRRQKRRLDARNQLRAAHELFAEMGAVAFADRARRELLATGERARKRRADTANDLTPQEAQIAQLAATGATNQEIAAQLFLSPSTVDYHLGKVFRKLSIRSRRDLRPHFG